MISPAFIAIKLKRIFLTGKEQLQGNEQTRFSILYPKIRCMKYLAFFLALFSFSLLRAQSTKDNPSLADMFKQYTEETYRLNPVQATFNGDMRYNDQLPVTFTESYNQKMRQHYTKYLSLVKRFDRKSLSANDQISYDIFKRDMEMALEGLTLNTNRIPITQFGGLHQTLAQLGSGTGAQPFKTVKVYEAWLSRAKGFPDYVDSAFVYFRIGLAD